MHQRGRSAVRRAIERHADSRRPQRPFTRAPFRQAEAHPTQPGGQRQPDAETPPFKDRHFPISSAEQLHTQPGKFAGRRKPARQHGATVARRTQTAVRASSHASSAFLPWRTAAPPASRAKPPRATASSGSSSL